MIKIGKYFYKNLLAYILVEWFKKPAIKVADTTVRIEPLQNIKLCHNNCPFLFPKEITQTNKKESHRCACYDKTLKHYAYHPHIVACKECKNLSVKKEFYYYDSYNN